MMERTLVPLLEPVLDDNARRYVNECLDQGYVSSAGPFVAEFESEFAKAVGIRNAVACASGTAALHVALRVAGARPGVLVALPTFTFIASANAATYTGADLLLVDSEPGSWNVNADLLHDEVVRRARRGGRIPDIVEVVHVLGHPADIAPLLDLRERFGVKIVEDAAEALGASWTTGEVAGSQVGTVGDAGCFSFNGNKVITTGGGGMIVTAEDSFAAQAKHLTTQAKALPDQYVHDDVGYNYRMTNVAAALGLAQLQALPAFLQRKREIAKKYNELCVELSVVQTPNAYWAKPSFWLYSLLVRNSAVDVGRLVEGMRTARITTRRLWPPLHRQKPYAAVERLGGEVAEGIFRRGISLPSSVNLMGGEQVRVVDSLRRLMDGEDGCG